MAADEVADRSVGFLVHTLRTVLSTDDNTQRLLLIAQNTSLCPTDCLVHRYDLIELLADLLATKLQVVEITEREYRDIISLLNDHEVSSSDAPETINGKYLAKLCSEEWGIY